MIEETLQRLWRLRFDGGDFVPEAWPRLEPREGAYTDQALELDVRPAAAADPTSPPARRRFDLRPLLDPPAAGQDRLDQVLQWLAEQEARLGP